MALLQQQSIGARTKARQHIAASEQTMYKQYMTMNPTYMTFQTAQNLKTPEQTRPSYKYEFQEDTQLVSPEEGKEDRG
eukprot:5162101-Ditylum_brightwellii.AAC.1